MALGIRFKVFDLGKEFIESLTVLFVQHKSISPEAMAC
jgi:hypothetical protein